MDDLKELLEITENMKGFAVIAMTDCFTIDQWPCNFENKYNENKLLELRVFNQDREVKLSRGDLGSRFHLRVRDDQSDTKTDYYDELQILDYIPLKDTDSDYVRVQTISGGKYNLPGTVSGRCPCIRIRKYFGKYASGRAYVKDWRCVGFEEWNDGK